MKTKFDKFNENQQYGGVTIHNYVEAGEFSRYIEFEFGINSESVYDRLLDNDYIEGSLGSRWSLDDYTQSEVDKGNEIAEWYSSFLINILICISLVFNCFGISTIYFL